MSANPLSRLFSDTNLVINSNGATANWPSHQLTPPITHPDRLLAVDGQPIASLAEARAIFQARQPGDMVELTLARPVNFYSSPDEISDTHTVSVELIQFSGADLATFFWAPFLVGFTILIIGGWTFYARPDAPAAQVFALLAASLAWGIGGVFEFTTTQWFIRLWLTGVIFGGPFNLLLASIFPQPVSLIRRWPWLRQLIFLPPIIVWIWAQWTLVNPNAPWAYVISWRVGYAVTGSMILVALAVLAYRGGRAESPLARQQGRVMFGGALIAFMPLVVWLFAYETAPFIAALQLTPLIIYPLTIGYTIIRYRLLNLEDVLRRGLTYLLLTAALALLLTGLAAFWAISVGPMVAFTNPLLLAFIALLLALAIAPTRDWLQGWIDRLFFRKPVAFDRLLRQYNRELTSAVQVDEVAQLLLGYAKTGLPDSKIHLYLPDSQMGSYGMYPAGKGLTLSGDLPLIQALKQEPAAIFLGELHTWPSGLQQSVDLLKALEAAVIAPMTNGQTLWGWLAVGLKQDGERFTQLELNYLSDLAHQSILGVECVHVIRRLEERVAQLDELSQFSQALNFTIAFDDLLELVFTHCQRLLHARDFFIVMRDSGGLPPYYVFWVKGDDRLLEKEGPNALVTDEWVLQALQTGQKAVEEMADGRYRLAVPLNAGADTLGVIYAHSPKAGRPFNQRQQQLFSVYADRAATALDRWLTNQQVVRRVEQLAALNDLMGTLTSTLNVEQLLELILDKSLELMQAEAGSFLMVHEDTGELVFRVARGPGSQGLLGARLPIGVGLAGAVAQSGQPAIVNSVQDDQRWFDRIAASAEFTTRSILTAPLLRYRQVIGVLQVINKQSGGLFTEEDQTLMTAFAGQAVVALENARLLYQTDVALQNRVFELSLLQQRIGI